MSPTHRRGCGYRNKSCGLSIAATFFLWSSLRTHSSTCPGALKGELSNNSLTLPKERKLCHHLLRILDLPLQHLPMLLAPHPNYTLELLRPDIEPFGIGEDVVRHAVLGQYAKCPEELGDGNE